MSEDITPQQVHAVAVAASTGGPQSRFSREAGKIIQQAMTNAVTWCYARGITDPEKVREKMMVARENAKRVLLELENKKPDIEEGNLEG